MVACVHAVWLIGLLYYACLFGCGHCKVIGGFVLPHGGIALDPAHFNTSNATARSQAWAVHRAAGNLGRALVGVAPDLVLLSTPHGVADLTKFAFYLNPKGFGWADTDNCLCPPCCYNVSVDMAANQSIALVHFLESLGANVTGTAAYGPPGQEDEPFPLRWGEVIPLHFIRPSQNNIRLIVLSQPTRRYTEDVAMVTEMLKLGADLYHWLDQLEERVAVLISADLAHTHLKTGPYGYSNASGPFDEACGEWAETLEPRPLLVRAAGLVDRALSCGFTGLVMLHGLLEAAGQSVGLTLREAWEPHLLANYHPSYYGMMVAYFTPASKTLS